MQESQAADEHDHPTWHHNLRKHTRQTTVEPPDSVDIPYLKEWEKACNLQEARASIKKERKFG